MKLLERFFLKRSVSISNRALFDPDTNRMTTSAPKVLWIELTSKCPFTCVFCTREVRWGAGRNLDFDVYRSLIQQLDAPEFIGLNYSGESIHYPRLLEAIALARSTGAYTELVTALSSAPESLVRQIVESNLDRLAVSIHTLDKKQYQDIYGFGSAATLKRRIDEIVTLKAKLNKKTPKLDFCFVAMSQNLDQLPSIARYAMEVGAAEMFIHPIIGRHPVPFDFSRELHSNKLTPEFKDALRSAVAETRTACPSLPLTVLNPGLDLNPMVHPIPQYYAPPLPPDGRIHTCDQSPFESVHILANGDVVVCEVHDETALGNLHSSGIREIWQNEQYRDFRRRYINGLNPGCRDCVWKTAYQPLTWTSRIDASAGFSPQLTRGWWIEAGAPMIWAKKQSVAEFRVDTQAKRVRVAGVLPNDPVSSFNMLDVKCGSNYVASIENPSSQFLDFERTLQLPNPVGPNVVLEFNTHQVFRPARHSDSADCRDLGFALRYLELL